MIFLQLCAGIFSLLDVAVTCAALARGIDWKELRNRLIDLNIATTGLDFLIFSSLRAILLITTLIVRGRSSKKKQNQFTTAKTCIYIIAVGSVVYFLAKLLIYSETKEFLTHSSAVIWFCVILGWSILATITNTFIFKELVNDANQVIESSTNDINIPKIYKKDKSSEKIPLVNWTVDVDPLENRISSSEDKRPTAPEQDDLEEENKNKQNERARTVTVTKMLSYAKQDVPIICLAFIFLTGAALAETFIPLFTGRVISVIAIDHNEQEFLKNIVIMVTITIAASLCAGFRGVLMVMVTTRYNLRIRKRLFTSLIRQEIGFFDVTRTGDILSRITADTTTMSNMIGSNCNIFIRNVFKGIGTCVFMFSLSWRLSLITFMALPLVIGGSKLYGNYYKKLQRTVQSSYAYANEVAEEVISTMKTVRSFANESGENERYNERLKLVYKVRQKQALAYGGFMSSTEVNKLALVTLTLWYGGHLVLNEMMESGNLISFILYQIALGTCMSSIGNVFSGLMQSMGAAEKVFQMIEREPKININKGDFVPTELTGNISFENVTFAYPSRPDQPIIKNLSFVAPAGKVTALVGPSGGGKSSCVNLLQYFYECMSGSIKIDGNLVQDFDHKYLHRKIALVGQEPVLYARSVKENISYGLNENEFGMEEIVEAARKANAHSFITELTEQYLTETGEKGTQLSGGQKQRVAIARALIRNPKILILDEATSALDAESEYLVQQALQNTMKHRTVIVIAHRLSTVESADKIVVINKGEVAEQGTPSELMENTSGLYYKLVKRQLHEPERRRNKTRGDKN